MLRLRKGQTLVEIVVASSILAVIAALAAVITARVYSSYEVIKAENEARKTIEETLHSIAYGDGEGLIDATSIHSDATYQIDSDDFTFIEKSLNAHYIRYVYDSTNSTLERREYDNLTDFNNSAPSSTTDLDIAGSVDFYPAVTFEYFTNDETEITNVTSANVNQITRVQVTIIIRVSVGGDYRVLTVHTSVRPLNLYNL